MSITRISLGLGFIVIAVGVIASGMTGAFFSDTETSTGNQFTAGAIDLKIDNTSYYNGNVCEEITAGIWQWQGTADYPVPGTPCTTSFGLSDLDDGLLFFDFNDVKPDDEGEDTISVHVQNDAWACMDVTLTSDDDRSSNEPELETGDDPEDLQDAWDGELAGVLEFFWWADDGDNVYEVGEQQISEGVQSLENLAPQDSSFEVTLADSQNNAWGDDGDPLPGGDTVYIGKAWCVGTLTLDPVAAGQGVNPSVDPGVDCDGESLGNEFQTDGVELTISFEAVQARHNEDFLCEPPDEPDTGTITVNKALLVSTAGIEVANFELHINGPGGDQVVSDEVPVAGLPVGSYTVSEVITGDVAGKTFTVTFSGACNSSGELTLGANDSLTCNILNNENGDGIGD